MGNEKNDIKKLTTAIIIISLIETLRKRETNLMKPNSLKEGNARRTLYATTRN